MKILILHHDKNLVDAITEELREPQYQVHYASDSETWFDITLARQFDLIVMEWMFHKIDGLTVLKKIRQLKIWTPVLIVTADDSVQDIVKSLDSGANDCVTTPFDMYVLIARMKALIRRSKWDLCAEVSHDTNCFGVLTSRIF